MLTPLSPPVLCLEGAVYIGIFLLSVWLLRLLWNMTIPQVLGLKEISYWQSFRLAVICMILFGNQLTNFSWGLVVGLSNIFMF